VTAEPALAEQPALLAALDEALAPGGTSAADPTVPAALWDAALAGPAAAFLVRPGKDVRARLVRAGAALAGNAEPTARLGVAMRAIELLHAGSLIIDDVEDDGAQRRGAPALHRIVGAPLAINTGSWMYFWALAELDRAGVPGAPSRAVVALVRCHQGQALDLATTITELDARAVPAVVAATTRMKTGALCRLATELGALSAGADGERVAAIGAAGEAAGCALQMLDDLSSLTGRPDKACEDLRAARATWAWAWLAEHGDPFAWTRLVAYARAVLDGADPAPLATLLAAHVEPIGRRRVREAIDRAVSALRAAATPGIRPGALDELTGELRAMEAMYG
jgi:geranylgeranyl pyrophosphate synthase